MSTTSAITILSKVKVTRAGGTLLRCSHEAKSTACNMVFSIFLPHMYNQEASSKQQQTPVLYFLSGLTCTDQNFCQKAGPVAFAAAEQHNLAMVVPDTSPRGDDVPNDDAYDLGQGAGFYINATAQPWKSHYQMESYVQDELPSLVATEWPGTSSTLKGITGHSMGGHGALTLAFKSHLNNNNNNNNTPPWISASALAPICHPTKCPWGTKAFANYLGTDDKDSYAKHDATELLPQLKANNTLLPDILVDQGMDDEFLEEQLRLDCFEAAAKAAGQNVTIRRHPGMDHSYYFIAACIADHVDFHAKQLKKEAANNKSSS